MHTEQVHVGSYQQLKDIWCTFDHKEQIYHECKLEHVYMRIATYTHPRTRTRAHTHTHTHASMVHAVVSRD